MADITIKQVVEAIGAPAAASEWAERIQAWNDIYACVPETITLALETGTYSRPKRSLRMGKRGCEDWASLLWTENCEVESGDAEQAVLGPFLGDEFASDFAQFLESEPCAAGIGGMDIVLDGLVVGADGTVSTDANTTMTRDLVPADSVIPLKWKRDVISEVAFVTWEKDAVIVREHRIMGDGYRILNRKFIKDGGKLKETDELPEGLAPVMEFPGSPPLFAIVRPAIKNNLDKRSPFGIPVFANALDQLKAVDDIFDNFGNDFRLGRKIVFLLDTMLKKDSAGNNIPPDRTNADMYIALRDAMAESKQAITEHNPELRVEENTAGLDAALSLYSTAIGMGAERYVYRGETVATATQIVSENSELFRNRAKHMKAIESALVQLCRGALWVAANVFGQPVDSEAEIVVKYDDSVIEDDTTRLKRGMEQVNAGLLSKRTYLIEYRGMTEEAADEELARIRDDLPTLI